MACFPRLFTGPIALSLNTCVDLLFTTFFNIFLYIQNGESSTFAWDRNGKKLNDKMSRSHSFLFLIITQILLLLLLLLRLLLLRL